MMIGVFSLLQYAVGSLYTDLQSAGAVSGVLSFVPGSEAQDLPYRHDVRGQLLPYLLNALTHDDITHPPENRSVCNSRSGL
jgi:hypothetical protein